MSPPRVLPLLRAHPDAGLRVCVTEARELWYRLGPDAASDRPAHVRAGSGLCWHGDRLWLVQDDARFFAGIDPQTGMCEALALPEGPDRRRLHDDTLGTKHLKLDLEAAFSLDGWLYGLGSGTKRPREVVVAAGPQGEVIVREARPWFEALRAVSTFAGSEMNLEGMTLHQGRLVIANRGNGAGGAPVDALAFVDAVAWRRAVHHGGPWPGVEEVWPLDLGQDHGRLTITDLASTDGRMWYLAAAEASVDATQDGLVTGLAIGVVEDRRARFTRVVGLDGAKHGKAEGLAVDDRGGLWAITDPDEPSRPAWLLRLEVVSC